MNLARQLRKKYLLWSWKQRLAYFILAIIVSSVAFTFVFVICEVHYDENYNFQFKYCIPKDSTPHNYYYHYFTGNFEQHSFLGSWGDFHYLNMSFFSNEKEEKLIVKNREAFGDIYNFRVNLVNVEAYLQRNRPHFLKYIPQMNRVELSDYLRYLNIVVGGGIYSDVDVELVTPIRYWVSSFNYLYSFFYNVDDFDFVIGVERDDPLIYNTTYKTHKIPFQLCQWVFAGKKGSRMFARIVEGIEENVMHKMPSLSIMQQDVMVKTGPAGFTLIILDVISNYSSIPGKDEDGVPYAFGNIKDVSQNGKILNLNIDGQPVTGMILPRRAFAAVGGDTNPLVSHKFRGSWKGKDKQVRLPYSPTQGYQKYPGEV